MLDESLLVVPPEAGAGGLGMASRRIRGALMKKNMSFSEQIIEKIKTHYELVIDYDKANEIVLYSEAGPSFLLALPESRPAWRAPCSSGTSCVGLAQRRGTLLQQNVPHPA